MSSRPLRAAVIRRVGVALTVAGLIATSMPAGASAGTLNETLVQGGLSSPVYLTHAGDSRLFVVEQGGDIEILGIGTFLDISTKISTGGERGLLGLAFHPSYASNRLFYVFYTRASDGDLVFAEYRRSMSDPNDANENSERILLTIEHSSATNHNGGWMDFKGGLLYIATGDGASNPNNAQNRNSLLGKILRINPLDPPGSAKYSIPPKNPYVGRAGRDEVFALGLRNPWRCSHDPMNGRLWCNDVGDGTWEEINRVKTGNGINFRWPALEGRHPRGTNNPCTSNCKTLPIAEYSHSFNQSTGSPCTSTTGGYVSRRPGATMIGKYIFGDFCSGFVWTIPADFVAGGSLPAPIDTNHSISSFGRGVDGKLYLVDIGGAVYRLNDS